MTLELGDLSRRDFLKSVAAVTGLGAAAFMGGCEDILEQIRNRPIRKNIASLDPSHPDLVAYKAAVTAMKALPSSDPRNWTRQAQIHGTAAAFARCIHRNWWFLPWHRAYLFYFERICRQMSGNQSFALPYWNWTQNRRIPAQFWGASNPLFHANRGATATSQASPEFVGTDVMDAILDEPNFLLFAGGAAPARSQQAGSGSLEATPHNYIHNFVNGDMGQGNSPMDPIFWTHHNMVEYCWVEWNINRRHPNTNDNGWLNLEFTGDFFDENGNPTTAKVSTTLLYPILSYQFERTPFGTSSLPTTKDLSDKNEAKRVAEFLKKGADVQLKYSRRYEMAQSLTVAMDAPAGAAFDVEADQLRSALESEETRVLLTLAGVDQIPAGNFFVRVFVDLPSASRETAIDDPHYAGSFAFFGGEHGDHEVADGPSFIVDLTKTVRRLAAGGSLSGQNSLPVRLVTVPFPDVTPTVRQLNLKRMQLGIAATPRQ
jgi:tyrosinase